MPVSVPRKKPPGRSLEDPATADAGENATADDPEWSPELEESAARSARVASVKRRLKRHFPRRRQKNDGRPFAVSTRNLQANISTRNISFSVNGRESVLKAQNRKLAQTLNMKMVENQQMAQYVIDLRDENLALIVERGELRQRILELESGEWDAEALEAYFQRRLVEYLEPVKAYMSRVLDHTQGLSDNLAQTMLLVSAPGRRSRSMAVPNNSSARSLSSGVPRRSFEALLRKDANGLSKTPRSKATVAHVSPRVGGHVIHKPQIEIQRLDMNAIHRLQQQQRRQGGEQEREVPVVQPAEVNEGQREQGEEEIEDEPLEPHQSTDAEESLVRQVRRMGRSTNPFRMSVIGEDHEEADDDSDDGAESDDDNADDIMEESVSRSPMRKLQKSYGLNSFKNSLGSPVVVLRDASLNGLLEQYNLVDSVEMDTEDTEQENEDSENEEYFEGSGRKLSKEFVRLVPRLVLERVTAPERKSKSASSPRVPKSGGKKDEQASQSASPSSRRDTSEPAKSPTRRRQSRLMNSVEEVKGRKTFVVSQSKQTEPLPRDFMKQYNEGYKSPRKQASGKKRKDEHNSESYSSEESGETPKSRESPEQFVMRLWGEDPMEGPSWLFGDNNKAKKSRIAKEIMERKKRSSSISFRAQMGECSKKLNMSAGGEGDEAPEETAETREELAAKGETAKEKREKRVKKRTVQWSPTIKEEVVIIPADKISKEPKPLPSPVPSPPPAAVPSPPPPAAAPSSSKSTPPPTSPPSGDADLAKRPKRRAAAAAATSLKEPSLTKKLRREDPLPKSIYSEKEAKVDVKKKSEKSKKR